MGLRTSFSDRSTAASGSESTAARSRWRRLVGHLLTAVGLVAFTYAVLRVLGPRDDVPVQSVDEVRAEMDDVVPEELQRLADDAPDDRSSSIDTIRNRVGSSVPDEISEIAIDDPGSDASETDPDAASAPDANESEGDSDALGEAETSAEYTAGDRSDEEIAERAASNVQAEPAEPGEMTVADDIADELLDTGPDADAESEDDAEE
ncbi:hypothetical protein [Natrinema longum]|uniref:Uncharacterized protein n=1 Tax=Natrinema longum TaxID=370324 RepID=A0A8A2U6S0_9EURY|nr:hypothetical protein [Natrinema longum]MBZ6494361.1 hypothetical protein [Natrinema longum]QSW84316.1 hypothetical protein J0X27_12750 [Natrinema longum]